MRWQNAMARECDAAADRRRPQALDQIVKLDCAGRDGFRISPDGTNEHSENSFAAGDVHGSLAFEAARFRSDKAGKSG
jgi:hypothetical protein